MGYKKLNTSKLNQERSVFHLCAAQPCDVSCFRAAEPREVFCFRAAQPRDVSHLRAAEPRSRAAALTPPPSNR